MATFLDVDRVLVRCNCASKTPLCRLYFCRHCLKLRCGQCVSHEVDSYYCPNCLENMPTAEAKLKKNRCANCFDCPSCHHFLSTRASSQQVPDPNDPSKTVPKKVYYLACGFCRWTSRDVFMKDQTVASGGWQDQENPHFKRISTLLEYYRQLAQREKVERERKKYTRRRSYLHFSDKYGLTSVVAKKRVGMLSMASLSLKEGEELKPAEAPSVEASIEVELLPEEIFTQPLVLEKVTNIAQRLHSPEFQLQETGQLYPRHKGLLIKRSQRCKECEHNLSKPEFNPSSIKFKIQLVAMHHVPEIRIKSVTELRCGQPSDVVLTMSNPVENATHVTLQPNPEEDSIITGSVDLPDSELLLAAKDDTAEFDESLEGQQEFKDDPNVIVFRKANKIGFALKATPLNETGNVVISFLMSYNYRNMTTALQGENKEPQTVWLEHPVYVNLGSVKQ